MEGLAAGVTQIHVSAFGFKGFLPFVTLIRLVPVFVNTKINIFFLIDIFGGVGYKRGKGITMRPKSLIPKNALAKRKRPDAGELPLDAIRELSKIPDLQEHFKNSTQSEKERIITFLRTFNSEAAVGAMFGVTRRSIERAVSRNRGIMDNAKMARGMAIAGLAEDKAIETLRGLDISKVPDERKGRLVKDLVDSASIASESIKPPEKKAEESTMELIFRIRNRGQQPLPKPVESEEPIEGEFEEIPRLPEGKHD